MLERINIRNYKCLVDLTLEMGMFNVLIGPNDSGKTSVLDAIHLLSLLVHAQNIRDVFQKTGNVAALISHGAETREIAFETVVDGMAYSLSVNEQGNIAREAFGSYFIRNNPPGNVTGIAGDILRGLSQQTPGVHSLATRPAQGPSPGMQVRASEPDRAIGNAQEVSASLAAMRCNLRPESLRKPTPPAGDRPDPTLESTGRGLPTVLDYMLLTDLRLFLDLQDHLRKLMPYVEELKLLPQQKQREVAFRLRGDDKPVPASLASDGLLYMLGFLTLLYRPGVRPSILLVDEPENGIHPGALREVVNILRELVDKENVQVVMTTHSPYLLDLVEPEEVYILTRAPHGDLHTKATRMSEIPKIEILRKGYELGELWTNYGEKELIEGKVTEGGE